MKLKKSFQKHFQWLIKHSITVFSCVVIIALGITALTYADPVTTTIGENINTNSLTATGLTVSGNATTTGSFVVSGESTMATTTLSGDLDLSGNELKNAILEKLANFPSSPAQGQMFYSTASTTPYWYTGSEWKGDISGATFVVAASDSLNKEKADYICDGVNDQVEIQAAIDALPSIGGTIVFMEGTYNTTATIHVDSNNIHLKGAPATQNQGSNFTSGSADPVIQIDSTNGVTLESIGVNCSGSAITGLYIPDKASFFRAIDVNIYNCRKHGIWLAGRTWDSWFSRIIVHSCGNLTEGYHSVYLSAPSTDTMNNVWFNNCFIHDFYGHGIMIDAKTDAGNIQDIRISDTKIHYTGSTETTPENASPVFINGADAVSIIDSHLVGSGANAAQIDVNLDANGILISNVRFVQPQSPCMIDLSDIGNDAPVTIRSFGLGGPTVNIGKDTDEPILTNIEQSLITGSTNRATPIGGLFPYGAVFESQSSAPQNPRQGMLSYADGSNWDPGRGEGIYLYNGNDWLAAKSLWTDSSGDAVFISGNVGIGTTTPAMKLDLYGGMMRAFNVASSTCSATTKGGIFYNEANDSFWGCKSSGWVKLDN